ncbi:MAG: pantetheine-phosphate adenylyltransferase [Phycisphaeraceae bacterium]|nr:pantetheine-phosphate adenylyltransferase [Phycisphaeraceae bacterium]
MSPIRHIALFPGTFDPMTNGHLDVVRRGRMLFDEVVVAVGHNPDKQELFTQAERVEMVTSLIAGMGATGNGACPVRVEGFGGLTVDFAKQIGATVILRGLRNVTDLQHEFQLALTNQAVANVETVFMMTSEPFAFTSSSLIKQIAAGGDIDRMHRLLPPLVIEKLKERKAAMGKQISKLRVDGLKD